MELPPRLPLGLGGQGAANESFASCS